MTIELSGLCRDHTFESSEDVCRRCGGEYCELCLVFPFGPTKPYCKECAITAGGVRAQVTRPALGRRDMKKKVKAFEERKAAKAVAAAATDTGPVLADPLAPSTEDFDRVAPAAPLTDEGAAVADELAASFHAPPPAPVTAPAAAAPAHQEPVDGLAPPIDWNQPFG